MKWFVVKSHLRDHLLKAYTKAGIASPLDVGWGNGYVVIPKDHPWFNVEEHLMPVNVNGGITFSSIINLEMLEIWKELDEQDIGDYLIGFDTGHYNDTFKKWPKKRVIQETIELERQIRSLGERVFID